jgi:two-component system LytT family response regulator
MSGAPRLRVVVADDERPARSFLMALLRGYEDVSIVGEAADGATALALIEREAPDLALLDLQMPELDGLEVVRLLRRDPMPLVAFVTAYDHRAVDAFELNAVDYLLKPVEPGRLRRTIDRAIERLERRDAPADDERAALVRAAAAATGRADEPGWATRIPIRRREDVFLVPVERIVAIEAEGEQVVISTAQGERVKASYTLKELEARLDPSRFLRLSRAAMARVDAIHKVSPGSGGTMIVTLSTGQQLAVSRIRTRALRDVLLTL